MGELTAHGESLPSLGHSVNVKEELCAHVCVFKLLSSCREQEAFPYSLFRYNNVGC